MQPSASFMEELLWAYLPKLSFKVALSFFINCGTDGEMSNDGDTR